MPSYTITNYTATIRQNSADIHMYADRMLACSIYFKPDDTPLQPASLEASGRIVLQYPLSQFASVVDLLRNESPYVFYVSPSVAYLSTAKEPVSEGEPGYTV